MITKRIMVDNIDNNDKAENFESEGSGDQGIN